MVFLFKKEDFITMNQNYKNHRKVDPLYHFGTALLGLIMLILSIVFFIQHVGSQWLLSVIVLGFALMFFFVTVKLRGYALQLQDRIIRTEENFRYYRLTGNLLDSKLSLKQVIALRFTDDTEFVELVERAIQENLSPDDIKKAVRNWRADFNRV
jgi:type II secretory pathway component PulF